MMLMIAIAALAISMGLLLFRAIASNSSYDRILSVNAFGSVTIAAILVITYMTKLSMFLDVAIIYALISFISTVALLAFVRNGGLDAS